MEETTLLAQPTVDPYPYLETLNPAQRTGKFYHPWQSRCILKFRAKSYLAVTYPPDAPLQVLAGPGSG